MKLHKPFGLVELILAVVILSILLVGCAISATETVVGSGDVIAESREVSGVSDVNLATIGDITVELGDTESLRIEAEDNLMEYFETEVRGGKLTVGTRSNVRLEPKKPVRYTLTVTGLDEIEISSVGDIDAPDLEAEYFSITIRSTGDLRLGGLISNELDVSLGSTGNLNIGVDEVKTQKVTNRSTGNYTTLDMSSDEAEVSLSSTGSATIWVRETLKANLSSSGD